MSSVADEMPGPVATGLRIIQGLVGTSTEKILLGAFGVGVLVAGWQLLTILGFAGTLLFPSPAQTALAFGDMVATGELYPHLAASGLLFFAALATGIIVGVPLGFLAAWFPTVRGLVTPLAGLVYSVPAIGLLPLFLVWFGFGFPSQFAVVLLFTLFPPYYAAVQCVTDADAGLMRVARSYGASNARLFRAVILPGSVPVILYAIRIAVVMAIRGVVLAELVASTVGLGFLLETYGNFFETGKIFALVIAICLIGLAADIILRLLQSRFDAWRPHGIGKGATGLTRGRDGQTG